MSDITIEPRELSFLSWIIDIQFPSAGKALLLFEADQNSTGATAGAVTVKGFPFAPAGFNITPGGIVYPSGVTVPVIDKPSAAMMQKLVAWSTPYQLFNPFSSGQPFYFATNTLIVNLGLIDKSWDKKFSITMPPTQGIKGNAGTVTKVIVWFYASDLLPAPTSPFDSRIEFGHVQNFSTGGWLAIFRDDVAPTLTPSDIFNMIKSAVNGGTPIPVPVQDGSTDPVTDGGTLVGLFSTASPPVPLPPPFNTYTFVATSVVTSTPVPDLPGGTFLAGGVFTDGAKNTYDANFFSSEGFQWWVPSTYGHLGTPPEAVQAPSSVQTTSTSAVGSTAAYTQNYKMSADLKTLTKT